MHYYQRKSRPVLVLAVAEGRICTYLTVESTDIRVLAVALNMSHQYITLE